MRKGTKGYFLKEYGSWSVLVIAYLIGLGVSRSYSWKLIPLFLALGLLINSKQAFMTWLRKTDDRQALIVFLGQVAIAAAVLLAIFRSDVPMLLPLLVFPAAYLLSNKIAGEHAITTELLGFVLLSLAAILAKFLLTGGLDVRLFLGVAFYFTAGVFKIKTLLLKRTSDRILTFLDIVIAIIVYRGMHIPLIILLPLTDNAIAAATLYTVRLRTTGWIEVVKSLMVMGLFIFYY